MADRYQELAALLARARRAALAAATLAGLVWALAALGVALFLAALAARWLGPAAVRPALLAAAAATGVGFLGYAALWLRRGLRSERVVALRLAAAAPEARSDLLTAVELHQELSRTEPGAESFSRALAHAAVERSALRASRLDPRLARDVRGARRAALALGAAASLNLVGLALVPGLASSYRALAAGVANGALVPSAVPIAGDIELLYRYPAYARLAPKKVVGTGGEIRALPGTEVEIVARADRDVERALLVTERLASPMKVEGRVLSGKLLVTVPGSWRLRYAEKDGEVTAEGPPVPIAVEPDLAPEVELVSPLAELEVNPDSSVAIQWRAADDFGLGEVALVFRPEGASKDVRKIIGGGQGQDKSLSGDYGWQLSELSLRPGDRIAYYIEALDKDTVNGPKRGVSRTQVLKVFSAAEHHREAVARAEALWERMILLLADRIEPQVDPERMGGGKAADEAALALVSDLRAASSEIFRDKAAPREIAAALQQIARGLEKAARRTINVRRVGPRLLATALSEEIEELEKDVLYLEDLIDRRKVEDLVELGKELRESQRSLARAIEKFREAKDDATRRALEQEIARLKDRIAELYRRMAELSRGIRDEHLNQEAMAELAKNEDMLGGLDEVQRLLAEGKIDEALKALDRLGQKLDEMVNRLDQERGDFGSEEYRELAQKMGEAMKELEEISDAEERIARETDKVREAARSAMEEKVKTAGERFIAEQTARLEKARKKLSEIDREVLSVRGFEEELDRAEQRLKDAAQALSMKDFDEARGQAQDALRSIAQVGAQLMMEEEWLERLQMSGGDERRESVRKQARAAGEARQPVQKVIEELERLLPRPGQGLSEAQKRELERLAEEQRGNQARAERLRGKMDEIAREAPLGNEPSEMLGEAARSMESAAAKLQGKDPRGGAQDARSAIEKLGQIKESLRRRGGGGGGGVPLPFMMAGSPDGRGGDGADVSTEKVEIPRPEQFQSPEEFRRELMEAMKQGVPEAYKDRVKDYYQELVK